MTDLPNFEHVRGSLYVARTQAGFKQALKHYRGQEKYPEQVYGYPKSYPSFVLLSEGYQGYTYISAYCWPVNFIAEVCARHTPQVETPEAEGIRLAREGCGLSNVYGSVSEENFEHLEIVLDAFTQEVARHVQTI